MYLFNITTNQKMIFSYYQLILSISIVYLELKGRFFLLNLRIPHPFATKNSVRLACVKHMISVHPEPGSNSFLFI